MEIQQLISEYIEWLKNEITFEKVGEYFEITTPYLDSSNDYVQIYVREQDGEIYFTDDSYTLQNLKSFGLKLTPARKQALQQILFQYGVTLKGDELTMKAPAKQFAQKKHLFLQAILRVDDMFSISKERVSSYFLDDIKDFFDNKQIYYSDNVQFIGKSGFQHNYDFLLQRNKYHPERLCIAINNPSRTTMGSALFSWDDTKPSRRSDSQLIVFLNDVKNVPKNVEEGFQNYDAITIKWSERNIAKNLEILSA